MQVDFLINKDAAEAAIKSLQKQLERLTDTTEKARVVLGKPISTSDSFAGTGINQRSQEILAALRRAERFRDSGAATGGTGSIFRESIAGIAGSSGLGGAVVAGLVGGGIAAIPAALSQATSAIFEFAGAAKDAFLEFQRGTRILKAQSIQTGIDFDTLSKKAENFGNITALSVGKSRAVFAQLANFARAAGQTEKLDQFIKAFTDLAAAKGINPEALGDIARQLNALTDEATDKLLDANPSAFFDSYAKSLGKTAGQLTDTERRAAVFNQVLIQGGIFAGQATQKFDELGGAALRQQKAYEDLKESIGQFVVFASDKIVGLVQTIQPPIAQIGDNFFSLGQIIASSVGLIDTSLEQIAVESAKRGEERFRAASSDPFRRAVELDKERAEADKRFQEELQKFKARVTELQKKQAEAIKGADTSTEGLALKKVAAELLTLSGIKDAASLLEARKRLDAAIAEQKQLNRSAVDNLVKSAQDAFSTGNRRLIEFYRKEFAKQANAIGDFRERGEIFEQFNKAIVESFEKQIDKAGKDVQKLRAALKDVLTDGGVSFEAQSTIIAKINKAIAESIKEATERVETLKKAARGLFDEQRTRLSDNPFVKLAQSSAAAFEKIKESTKGFGRDVRDLFLRIEQQIQAVERAKARIETRTQAAELEAEAANLRRPVSEVVERRLQERIRQAGFDIAANGELINQTQRAALDEFIKNERERLTMEEETARRRALIQAKIDEAESSVTAAEQRLADKAIIAATSGVDLATLSPEQRRAAIDAREREAARLRSAEAEAENLTREQTTLQQRIADTVENLFKVAKERGVDAVVKIIDETGGRIEQRLVKRPTGRDTQALLEQ